MYDVSLKYNLQFFAADGQGGEKTEPATEKKLSDARKEGQVAKSREIANAFGILALFIVMKVWIGNMGFSLIAVFEGVYSRIPEASAFYYGMVPDANIMETLGYALMQIFLISAPIMLVGFVVAFLSDVVQVKWKPTAKPLMPKFNKLNPISGFKKIFSMNAVAELVKSLVRIALIAYVAYAYIRDEIQYLFVLYDISLNQAIAFTGEMVCDLGIRIAAVYMIIALADFAFQKYKFSKDMRMTKQEIKEEYKQQEGDPQIKGKIRQRMREVSQRRMMQSLPQADVVITNPTHYAVAIKYAPEEYDAPVVLAKGENFLAQKIKEIAKENSIEIVENKPLARMLYANVEVGEMVPPELYQAVAEVLAFVYHLKGKN